MLTQALTANKTAAEIQSFMPEGATMVRMPSSASAAVIAVNLRRLMDHHKHTQDGLAALSGVGQGLISRILRADHSIRVDTLESLAGAYGMPPWALLVPALDPSSPPLVPMSRADRDAMQRLQEEVQRIVGHDVSRLEVPLGSQHRRRSDSPLPAARQIARKTKNKT